MIKADDKGFLICPICGKRTNTKVAANTVILHGILYCKWCKKEMPYNYKP